MQDTHDPRNTSVEGRVPPHDLDAEAAVLSAVLLDNSRLLEVLPLLDISDFYSDANRRIYEAYVDLERRGAPIDILTVRSWLSDRDMLERAGGSAYLAMILDSVPAVTNVSTYARMVKDKSRLRALISTMQEQQALAYLHAGSAMEMCDSAEAALQAVTRDAGANEAQPIKEALKEAFDRISAIHSEKATRTGVATGSRMLDVVTGGWQPTDVIIVGARPGVGKTAFGLQALVHAARDTQPMFGEKPAPHGNVALFLSNEMPKEQIAVRMLCQQAFVDWTMARDGSLKDHHFRSLNVANKWLYKLPIYVDDASSMSEQQVRSKVLRFKQIMAKAGYRLTLVVIDYLQLIRCTAKVATRNEAVGEVTRSLKALARDARVPLMVLCQLNRGPEDGTGRRPRMSDLRESGNIEQDADVIVFIHRPKYFETSRDDSGPVEDVEKLREEAWQPEQAELIVAKQRNGPTTSVRTTYVRATTRFDPPEFRPQDDYAGDYRDDL